jgi:cytochrome oxidase Cu insertion factor (SCO1/SenC/PrrC family)
MVLKMKVRLGVTGAIVLALLLGACVPVDNVGEPVLSNTLIRGCERTMPSGGFENVGLAVGETAIDFTLKDVYGNIVRLASLLGEKPVVMIFGSFT